MPFFTISRYYISNLCQNATLVAFLHQFATTCNYNFEIVNLFT
ncbi:MAG TPA: hypothetical protein DCM25_08890 [Rhodobacteraceae bacterium]|nr:hypothetical protein [Paracoccaceae bacterium]